MNHLEQLVFEFYDWKEYIVRTNTKVGKLNHGGWEMELDIVAYSPKENLLLHIEPSIDGDSWKVREARFNKKFKAGQKYIKEIVFPWLKNNNIKIEPIAILVTHPKNKEKIDIGTIISIDEFILKVKIEIAKEGLMSQKAIPEKYPLLRTIQLVTNGYNAVKSIKE